jgi:hypothetical protein
VKKTMTEMMRGNQNTLPKGFADNIDWPEIY